MGDINKADADFHIEFVDMLRKEAPSIRQCNKPEYSADEVIKLWRMMNSAADIIEHICMEECCE